MEENVIRLLLVEDNPGDARLMLLTLAEVTEVQFELTHVERLSEAKENLEQGSQNVVLLDLSLPDSHGIETFIKLHEHSPDVPVVVLTGLDDQSLAAQALQEGAQDYLVKGQVDANVLVRSVRYAIERQRTSHYRTLMIEREKFDAAVSQMSDGIIVTDGDYRIINANHTSRLLLNINNNWKDMSLDDVLRFFTLSESTEHLLNSKARLTTFDIARAHTRPPLYIDGRLTRMFKSDGQLLSTVLMLRDVTAERRSQNVRSDFLTMVSHKLLTPLSVLTGYVYLCKRLSPEELKGEWIQVIDACDKEIRRLSDTVRKLLDFKALSTQLTAQTQSANVRDAIDVVERDVRLNHPTKRIDWNVNIADNVTNVDASDAHLGFVLEKIAENAAKFADKDPVCIAINVECDEDSWIRFSIEDNGPGIPHEYYDRVFGGFVQVEDQVTGQVPGLGVGLAMARHVVDAYAGAISIQSSIGEGTTVTFTLPAGPARDNGG